MFLVTLNTTNDIKMKSNEELQKTDQEAQKIII